jgi:hypothetical protein
MKLILAAIILFILFTLLFVIGATTLRADDIIIDMRNFQEGDLLVDGLELKSTGRISLYAVGAELKHSDDMYAYCWIINSDNREPVWVLNEQETRRFKGSSSLREYEDEISLAAGKYECYYYAGRPYLLGDININIDGLGEALDWLGEFVDKDEEERHRYYTEDLNDLRFTIKAPTGLAIKFNPVAEIRRNSIIDFSEPGGDYSSKKGFTLKKNMTLKIMAAGEYSSSDRVFVDYGWIIDADSRKKVWQMDKWNTSWAGGGRKNRSFNGEIELSAGNYVAFYVTDDSHSFDDWNTQPPFDPLHYGLSIYNTNSGDRQFVTEYQDIYSEPVIIELTRIRDNAFESKGFTLKKETPLHIIAIGEFGYSDEFVDYGWIENVDDDEKVWEMTEENTEHAGGASKNRKFDGVVTLPAGNYMVYFISDDSHSYHRWNSTAPIEKEMWGITIFGIGKNFDPKSIPLFNEAPESGSLLVNLTRVGDDEDIEQRFRLTSPQKIHIFALGEGKDGEMYDYGWIESARSGEIVWEMTYRMTRHAGGSDKNRKVDTRIYLEAGEYITHYVTDGSHSFPDFNTAKPENPQKWGITIAKE